MPTVLTTAFLKFEAIMFRSYPMDFALARTTNLVSSFTKGLLAKALDTVEGVIFNYLAISDIVVLHISD
ncbi:MAG: hypothetical protein MR294_09715 [Bacteroidales bacterium]|nr:hypothetical protein [Bacteroidales bacterium]